MHLKRNTNGWKSGRSRSERRRDSWHDMGPNGLPTYGAMNTVNERVIPCKNPSHAVAMMITLNKKEGARDWIAFQNTNTFISLDPANVKREITQ